MAWENYSWGEYEFLRLFYRPSDEMVHQLLAIPSIKEDMPEEGSDSLFIEIMRTTFAVHVYIFVLNLAQSALKTSHEQRFSLAISVFHEELSSVLREELHIEIEYQDIIDDLLKELLLWIQSQSNHTYSAPWGDISFDGIQLVVSNPAKDKPSLIHLLKNGKKEE